jgi:hypothetical protein
MKRIRSAIAATTLAGGLAFGGFALSTTASAQVVTGGLVNVTITNVLNNNKVAVAIPINAAANICGVNVVVLAQQLTSGPVTCQSQSGNQTLTISQP